MKNRFLVYIHFIVTILLFYSCSHSSSTTEVTTKETTSPQDQEEKSVNNEPLEAFKIITYDGTIENARARVAEIIDAATKMRLSAYTYHYDNDSGENPMQGTLFFYYNPVPGKDDNHKDWYLRLATSFYLVEYFFDEEDKLFAIRQSPSDNNKNLGAEIFYTKDGSIMKGSWIQRTNDEPIDLAGYEGDYWYDFLEGYPFYKNVKQMKEDKSLQYQQ